jgi:hypothetical protein
MTNASIFIYLYFFVDKKLVTKDGIEKGDYILMPWLVVKVA